MKKYCAILMAAFLVFTVSCKKTEKGKEDNIAIKKYASIRIAVYKDKEMKNWLATLGKAEEVTLLSEESYVNPKTNKEIKIAKVKLTDDSIGYVKSRFLADQPIVFIEESKLYVRPTKTSRVHTKVPAGTIGFITDEKGNWVEVFIGRMANGKWIEGKWADSGYSTDLTLVVNASSYEKALNLLKDTSKPENIEQAKEILSDLADQQNVIGELARTKLSELDAAANNVENSKATEQEAPEEEVNPATE